jgi:Uma2 family endonuclease
MTSALPQSSTPDLAECGWRIETVEQPDGTRKQVQIPLTELEFLHPQEGYYLPNSTFHDNAIADAKDLLTRRYMNEPNTAVFSDLIIKWGIPNLGNHCPDVCVVFGIHNKEQNRTEFVVQEEGVRPKLIIEVVSPRYRRVDREDKVREYARAGVEEYIIIDRRQQRGQVLEEVIGYRLEEGRYTLNG